VAAISPRTVSGAFPGVEVHSSDRYTLSPEDVAELAASSTDVTYAPPDRGTPTATPLVTSQWVERASRQDLPSKSFDAFAPTAVPA
jgi:hypothetical protein